MNVLVAYFSASGVTEKVAKKLADVTAEWRDRNGGEWRDDPFCSIFGGTERVVPMFRDCLEGNGVAESRNN